MIITRQGDLEIKLQAGDTIAGINPPSKESKLKGGKFGANIALVSLNHKDFDGVDMLAFGDKKPFVISGPGEYEVKGVFIKGFGSRSDYESKKEKINTIYVLSMDGMKIVHLGALSEEKLSEEALEAVDDIDILMIQLGENLLSPAQAAKLAVFLEAKLIVPIGSLEDQKKFAKEVGAKPEETDKLTLKKKDLEGKSNAVAFI